MIFIGLREYVDTSYPGQTLYPNDFKYNFITLNIGTLTNINNDGTTTPGTDAFNPIDGE